MYYIFSLFSEPQENVGEQCCIFIIRDTTTKKKKKKSNFLYYGEMLETVM